MTPHDCFAQALRTLPLVAILRGVRSTEAVSIGTALVGEGWQLIEVPLNSPQPLASIEAMTATLPSALVGAGTVLTVAQVDLAVAAGASYVVSPGLSRAVVERCQELGVLALPGAVTATEIQAALELGLTTIKFFPAGTSGGAPAIKALAAPFAHVGVVPTGGVGPKNLAEYLSVPTVVAVGGSWMCPRDLVSSGDFAGITALTIEAVALAASVG